MRSLVGALLFFCGICSKYFSADRDEGKRKRFAHFIKSREAMFAFDSLYVCKIFRAQRSAPRSAALVDGGRKSRIEN